MKSSDSFLIKTLALLAVSTFVGFFFASQSYLTYLYYGDNADFWASVRFSLPDWYVWALLTPCIVWLSRRLTLSQSDWLRNGLTHLFLGLLFSLLKMSLLYGVTSAAEWLPVRKIAFNQVHAGAVTYWVIIGLAHAFDYYSKFREREVRTSQLETELARAELQVLKMQLQPHFLFNTLHSISSLMHKDVAAADQMMARLSELLRLTLDSTGVHEVPLKQELEFLNGYLEIEKIRFQDRLKIKTLVASDTLDASVPNLILQPLVENAVRHGIEPFKKKGLIQINAKKVNGYLEIQISDSGPGPRKKSENQRTGVGLANTQARLQQLYGTNFQFDFGMQPKGFQVRFEIPFSVKATNSNNS